MPGPTSASARPVSLWLRSGKFRRAFALSAVVLATGGLVLYKAPSSGAFPSDPTLHPTTVLTADGKNAVAFGGPGVRGVLSLSHSRVLSGQSTPVYAEVKLVADQTENQKTRAPISLALVLDTSGSMSGSKIEDARRSALRLLADMRDDDEIALVRYSDTSELIQPLARVGNVRSSLTERIQSLQAGGGTNIPGGLAQGLRTLDEAAKGRVRRIVLVSDGLDGTRVQAENLARNSFNSGITVSALGIGLDFDESYMGSVAQSGHGNFAFINDNGNHGSNAANSLAGFLKRELEQTALTTVENARVKLQMPSGMRFVSASGADATYNGSEVELNVGALFSGDERRIIVELSTDGMSTGSSSELRASASWNRVGSSNTTVSVPTLTLVATNDSSEVERSRDGAVLASATSVLASKRQLEASNAYARGDVATANALMNQNEVALRSALAAAPPAAAPTIHAQMAAYGEAKKSFNSYQPGSAQGKAATKSGAMKDLDNLNRKGF